MGSAAVLTQKPKGSAGTKRKGRENAIPKASKAKNNASKENGDDSADTPKRPKRAASCTNFKEKTFKLSDESSSIEIKETRLAKDETEAVYLTKQEAEENRPARKILDFIFHDDSGNPQSFEMSEFNDLYITALIMPMDDVLVKERERGVRCEGFGRIESWAISGYDEGSAVIWVSTEFADYECVKPIASYNKFYNLFYQKAHICVEVYQKISKSRGGNPNVGVQELLASVARSMSGSKGFPSGPAGMDFLVSLGDFVYNQIVGLDDNKDKGEMKLSDLPVLVGLRDECRKRGAIMKAPVDTLDGSLKINEKPKEEVEDEDDDMKLAKLLQEEEDWKQMKKENRRQPSSSNSFYVKINEDEIANDYPLPAYYKPTVQEADEYIFCENEDGFCHVEDLPRRILDNWAIYNSDSRLVPLELLPMKSGADVDVTIYASGYMREDDGGYSLEGNSKESSSGSSAAEMKFEGIPIYLSSIKEWMIEFGSSMIFVSIRTDMAWYRLDRPMKLYLPWFNPVLKTARLAVSIISLLKDQSRISKLSFSDVIKKLTEFGTDHSSYISSNLAAVERFVVVHGQIILQQFAEFPDEKIQKCAFVSGLADKMRQRRHTRLAVKKKLLLKRGINSNPSASMIPIESRKKLMRATMTKLINRIWGSYYANTSDETKEGVDQEVVEEESPEAEEEENEEEEKEETLVTVETKNIKSNSPAKIRKSTANVKKIAWEGKSTESTDSGEALYKKASVRGNVISVGDAVIIEVDEEEDSQSFILIEYMFQNDDGVKMGHGRILLKGSETVLGNAANERELFLTNDCIDFELGDMKESLILNLQRHPWGPQFRKQNADSAKLEQSRAEERKRKGLPVEYFCKSLYCPQKGAFLAIPSGTTGLGNGTCYACKERESEKTQEEFKLCPSKTSFTYKKIEYHVDDFCYVMPDCFEETNGEDRGTFKAGRNVGLRPFVVCQILDICSKSSKSSLQSTNVKVRRFYRPDDVSAEKAYSSDIRELYYSEDCSSVPVESLQGKCTVRKANNLEISNAPVIVEHTFFCGYSYNPETGAVKQLPANAKIVSRSSISEAAKAPAKNKGKGKCGGEIEELATDKYLATLDIFAGCGGLSEGLERSGASTTKWAIEYEEPAGEAFSLNHPRAKMFVNNCNVILKAIMEKCGEGEDCLSTTEAAELAAKLSQEDLDSLPVPGEVDFINGGPPCQGFSGMNRFNTSTWSKVQCEMILAFLSFADIFRPKFFLLENVRNFVSFNKGQTFRLTLASLLEMGYQVRFGVLEAGTFGVSQSRKRAFIWAASPEEILPEWPEPMHVFSGGELKIPLPGGISYAAVRSTATGAAFRPMTVRDTIGDLPPVSNGASNLSIDYGSKPVSWFQKQIRGEMETLNDHISKEMNELNLIRCKRIPKRPGADWHDLPEEKVKLSTGQVVDLIPWCLPNTAKKHNEWKGLFGRLDWEGNFPTSITDPQPMGKVGMCFHPDQDRIITVRECARSQGFPDSYKFAGTIQNKHRQIGNAVPPPLAYALGRKLKEAVEARRRLSQEA